MAPVTPVFWGQEQWPAQHLLKHGWPKAKANKTEQMNDSSENPAAAIVIQGAYPQSSRAGVTCNVPDTGSARPSALGFPLTAEAKKFSGLLLA